ncbi:MAG: transcriptional regulator [Verrucomicrobia bacterium RIFCSPHIGHO2_12_FULL_41_10]|nr:MAG: transcriptional regulator [Verrucomicrobia bacterium RIFCSPHIGHO2_12_FULL_41_10]HLB33883.1 metalloregulator ArsR/SmtB family transcription factor [Chthoniobacterales bacterium]
MPTILQSMRLLSEPTRLRLILLLFEEELTVAELQEILGMGQSRISASLAQLRRQGLVVDRRVGKNSYYTAVVSSIQPLLEVLRNAHAQLPHPEQDAQALQLVLHKRQDRAAEYFEKLAGKFGHSYVPGRSWESLAHGLLRLLPPLTIADLGAGEGTLSQLLARSAKQVIAIDNLPKMVEFGTKVAKENGFTNLEYRLGDIEDPPIESSSVDVALFSQALHHAVSPQRAVEAAFKILKPGGRILILDLTSHTYEQAKELYAHVWLGFSSVELHALLIKSGFKDLEVHTIAREQQAPHFQTVLATGIKPLKMSNE